MFLEQKEIEIDGKQFIISKFPAIQGREIISQYPLSGIPKLGDYKTNQDVMLKLMCYVGVMLNGHLLPLTTEALVNNHVPNWEMLAKIEMAMMEYNCSFFQQGKISGFLDSILDQLPSWTTKILTAFSEQSSAKEKQV